MLAAIRLESLDPQLSCRGQVSKCCTVHGVPAKGRHPSVAHAHVNIPLGDVSKQKLQSRRLWKSRGRFCEDPTKACASPGISSYFCRHSRGRARIHKLVIQAQIQQIVLHIPTWSGSDCLDIFVLCELGYATFRALRCCAPRDPQENVRDAELSDTVDHHE